VTAYETVMAERLEHFGEDNDCTVVALSLVLGIPYDVAHKMLADQGRQYKTGFRLVEWLYEDNISGWWVTVVSCPRVFHGSLNRHTVTLPTLAKVRRDFPRGRFIVRKRNHVFAMIEGVIHDDAGPRTRITHVAVFERA
jgi:hypothetical protein